jgi:hypothetical protein
MTLIDQSINLLLHFIAIKMNANYATQAGSAETAKTAHSAVNANYAQIAKEAERLNLGGTMIYVDPASHLIIFNVQGTDINKSLMIDPVNRNIMNVNIITDSDGNQILPSTSFFNLN